jgi:hypothetical protein
MIFAASEPTFDNQTPVLRCNSGNAARGEYFSQSALQERGLLDWKDRQANWICELPQ